jgi:N-acetylneuraminate synthase
VINGERLTQPLQADERLTIDHVDGPYSHNPGLRRTILERGLEE